MLDLCIWDSQIEEERWAINNGASLGLHHRLGLAVLFSGCSEPLASLDLWKSSPHNFSNSILSWTRLLGSILAIGTPCDFMERSEAVLPLDNPFQPPTYGASSIIAEMDNCFPRKVNLWILLNTLIDLGPAVISLNSRVRQELVRCEFL